jgi:hypothetical protein
MDPSTIVKAGSKVAGAAKKAKQLMESAAASSGSARSAGLLHNGEGAVVANSIESIESTDHDSLKIKETEGNIAVIKAFNAEFGTNQAVKDLIGLKTVPDPSQSGMSRYIWGSRNINTTKAGLLSFKQHSQDRYDLAMYIAFKRFQDKYYDQSSDVKDHKVMMLIWIPVIFDHFCKIKDTESIERRREKKEGLKSLSDFLNGCKRIVKEQKKNFLKTG